MPLLEIPATDESPHVYFDTEKGLFTLAGKSLPEDTKEFYSPVEGLVKSYVEAPQPVTTISINLVYLNSSSTKKLIEIVGYFERIAQRGYQVMLTWYYREHDEDMLEEGEEFARLTDLPVSIVKLTE